VVNLNNPSPDMKTECPYIYPSLSLPLSLLLLLLNNRAITTTTR
jgi:hypothetical protein